MAMIYLAELVAYTGAGTTTLRFSTGAGYNSPTAPGYYEPRILQPANFRRDIFDAGKTGGSSRISWGEMVLANLDGELDALLDYGIDGRSLTLMIGDDAAAYGSFIIVLQGTMEQPTYTWDQVAIRIRDRQEELDKPIQTTKYAGSNSLPWGLEGVTDDLQGRPKPKVYGTVYNVSPPNINTSRLIYQVNDGGVFGVGGVYDRGAALTAGADYISQADMETNAPAANTYRVWPTGGYFRLGSSPAGQITADVTQGASAAARTAAQIAKAIATGVGGISPGDVSSADITNMDTTNSAEVGIWIDSETTIRAALDAVCASVGAWWGFDRSGVFRIRRLDAPSGDPVVTFKGFSLSNPSGSADGDIKSLERVPTNDKGRGIPAYRIKLRYQRYWTTQPSDVAGVVTAARKAVIREEWREVTSSDVDVQAKHLLADEADFESLLISSSAAQAECDRLLTLYKTRRDRLKVSVAFSAALAAEIDLGSVVKVQIPRFGFNGGKLFVVTGLQYDAANNILDLDLWG